MEVIHGVIRQRPTTFFLAVILALFSLQAFGRWHKVATKLVADESKLPATVVRECLKHLARYTGLVGTTRPIRRAIWISRKVIGEPSSRYDRGQYLQDAANVQKLAQSVGNARKLLGKTNLSQLEMENNIAHRYFFNSIVKALTKAGHKGLPTYGISGPTFHWWLRTTSLTAAKKVLQKLTGQTTL